MSRGDEAPAGLKDLLGYLLQAVGGLIFVLSGLCTAGGLLFGLLSLSSGLGAAVYITAMSAVTGALPLMVGGGLFIVGRDLRRRRGPPASGDPPA